MEDRQRAIDEKRAKAERQTRWEAAMQTAKEQALQEQYAKQLRHQAERWRETEALRAYCDALEQRLSAPRESDDADASASARTWLAWARGHLRTIDPFTSLPTMPEPRTIEVEDLKPFLGRWSPYGPEADSSGWR